MITRLPSTPAAKPSDPGFTLIMSLILISLIAILVVGFLTSMRVERFSADSHLQGSKAQYYAQSGLDIAIARIQEATPPQSGKFAITQPGQIVTTTISGGALSAPHIYELHSGKVATYTNSADVAADFNLPRTTTTKNLLLASPLKLQVKWLYVRKDGSLAAPTDTAPPNYDANNPLVGRFAFWVDDESARINLNTATMRPPPVTTLSAADPAQVNLQALSSSSYVLNATVLKALDDFRTTSGHYFNSLAEAREVSTTISTLIDNEKFNLGTTSQTPDLNIFGEPRIMLTTQANLAGGAPFLDILKSTMQNQDPGLWENLDSVRVAATVATLTAILNRTDWPYKPGASFSGKYSPVRPEQIAINIIDYVRARESKQAECDTLVGSMIAGKFVINHDSYTATTNAGGNAYNVLFGLSRSGVRVTELGFYVSSLSATECNIIMKMELHLPPYSGLDSISLDNLGYWGQIRPGVPWGVKALAPSDTGGVIGFSFTIGRTVSDGTTTVDKPVLTAGDYAVVTSTFSKVFTYQSTYTQSSILGFMTTAVLRSRRGGSIPTMNELGRELYFFVPASTLSNILTTAAVDDPANNNNTITVANGDALLAWRQTSATWGAPPIAPLNTINTTPSSTFSGPQQDTDNAGRLTKLGIRFPSPKGTLASSTGQMLNPTGIMQSVAELGFIHTGNDWSRAYVPWRTLRLQPKKDADTLPDWALLDMFSVPAKKSTTEEASYFALTSTNSTRSLGGRINLNASIAALIDGGGAAIQRPKPLQAVFYGVTSQLGSPATLSITQSGTLASAITTFTVASAANGNTGNRYGFNYFLSRGELAEVDQIANGGEASEEILRNTVDLFTTRSNVFRVYSIGQVIKQPQTGAMIVLGERRMETLVDAGTNSATVRPFYSRNLKP